MTLFDALRTPEYFQNYEALLSGRPLPHGNLKGRVLNKDSFFKDHSDYEVLLRNKIPEKYCQYFNNDSKGQDDDDDDDLDIEIGRGPVNVSPQRRSIWSNDGVKETNTDELNLGNLKLKGKKLEKVKPEQQDSDSFNLEFETENLSKKPKQKDFINKIKSNEYKKLPNKTKPAEIESHLESLTHQLIRENLEYKKENESVKAKLDAANDIIKYEANAYEAIRDKLKIYVVKYKNATNMLQQLRISNQMDRQKKEAESNNVGIESNDNDKSEINLKIPEVEQIDEQIRKLNHQRQILINEKRAQLKNESKLANSTIVNINVTPELANSIANKLMDLQRDTNTKEEELKQNKFHSSHCLFCEPRDNRGDQSMKLDNITKQQLDLLLKHLNDHHISMNANSTTTSSSNESEQW